MKKIVFVILLLLVAGFLTRGILKNIEDSEKKVESIPEIQKREGIPVEVKAAEISDIKKSRLYTGTIKGSSQADAMPKIQERIEGISVKVGDRVSKGGIIATLSTKNPTARYQQSKLILELAEKELERIKTLFKEGALSETELDRTENAYKLAKTTFESVEEMVNVRTPISGIVTDIFANVGETVNPAQPIARISKFQEIELEIKAGESEINSVSAGQKVIIKVSYDDGNIYEGKVDRIALSADPKDRSFNVWILIPNKDMKLRPGMFVTAELIIQENKNSVVIDKDSRINDNSGSYVFVINEDLICVKKNIITGIAEGNKLEVIEGIEEGEKVIIRGKNKLIGGEKVLIVN